ncbi:MAG: MotA/TolQ/ExbB proton channel family protein [Phycisphaerales bacterium]
MMSVFLGQATGASAGAGGGAAAPGASASGGASVQQLFVESADVFTIVLAIGSVVAGSVIVRCLYDIRGRRVLRPDSEGAIRRLIREGKIEELRTFVGRDDAFVSAVMRAALAAPRAEAGGSGESERAARREAAEMAASEQCAAWFRKIEPLNVIGNLGPLLGLAGTVYGMIIAFWALGQSGGQANPATLSLGISKALFHTLLGLLLALPSLTVFGFYRTIVDRLCTRAMVISSELVEALPSGDGREEVRSPSGRGSAALAAGAPA